MTSNSPVPTAWQDAIVVLERPRTEELTEMGRQDKLRTLSDSTRMRWRKVLDQLREEGLADEVESPEPMSFNVLPIRGTVRALDRIRDMPGIVDVLPASAELKVDLLGA